MEVLNKKQRIISFVTFLLLFLVTIAVILVAVFFDYQIPKKELSELREENAKMRTEFAFQEEFAKDLEDLKTSTDSLNTKGNDFYFNQQKAISSIITMQQNIPAGDSLSRNNMYDNILLAYRDLIDAKKLIHTLGGSKEEIDELIQQIEAYKKELEIVKRDLEVCRKINRGGVGGG